jgi:membrane dipeptidase
MRWLTTVAVAVTLSLSISAQQTGSGTADKSAAKPSAPKAAAGKANAKAIHESAIVVDTHADTPMRFVDENYDPGTDAGRGHWDLKKVKAGNLGVEFFSIWVEPEGNKGKEIKRALDMIDSVYRVVNAHPDQMAFASGTKDIYALRRGPHKKVAILMGVEGGHAIDGDLAVLRGYYRLGVRYMTLTWSNSTPWAQSSGDLSKTPDPQTGKIPDPGLNDYGRTIVREMNRIGMMVDISHVSDRTFYHTMTVSRAPVIASHSSSRAITNVARNMTDDMLIALARNGGVAQVNFNCGFVSDDYNKAAKKFEADHPQEVQRYRQLRKDYLEKKPGITYQDIQNMEQQFESQVERPPLSALIDHIDHMVKIAGIDHVGIGSDFDGVTCTPKGIDSAADLPKITEELVRRGYTASQIHKILGGNLLRVFSEVEKVSRELQAEAKAPSKDTRKEVAPSSGNVKR